jgi:hypothetical protein
MSGHPSGLLLQILGRRRGPPLQDRPLLSAHCRSVADDDRKALTHEEDTQPMSQVLTRVVTLSVETMTVVDETCSTSR